MLVLTRKLGEVIKIGDQVKVVVVSIDGNSVKLGIEAPKEVPVHREEVYEKIAAENKAASSGFDKEKLKTLKHVLFKDKTKGSDKVRVISSGRKNG